jgi:hypothetical protein
MVKKEYNVFFLIKILAAARIVSLFNGRTGSSGNENPLGSRVFDPAVAIFFDDQQQILSDVTKTLQRRFWTINYFKIQKTVTK